MKKYSIALSLVLFLVVSNTCFSQEISSKTLESDSVKEKKIITPDQFDVAPEFEGGGPAWGHFLASNMNYPRLAVRNNIRGKVIAQFIVSKEGDLEDITILKSLGYGCDEEVIRVLSLSPKWRPGIYKGKPVRVKYTTPVMFTLPN